MTRRSLSCDSLLIGLCLGAIMGVAAFTLGILLFSLVAIFDGHWEVVLPQAATLGATMVVLNFIYGTVYTWIKDR